MIDIAQICVIACASVQPGDVIQRHFDVWRTGDPRPDNIPDDWIILNGWNTSVMCPLSGMITVNPSDPMAPKLLRQAFYWGGHVVDYINRSQVDAYIEQLCADHAEVSGLLLESPADAKIRAYLNNNAMLRVSLDDRY